jgi:hypothetical protein
MVPQKKLGEEKHGVLLADCRQLGSNRLSPSMRRPVDVKAYFAFFFP